MNKETFLEELRGYLRVLEDQEQEDILAEYAQHIDMKLQKGLSEEEAIRDFGPMRDLAAEILEAYHVKPEFGKKTSGGKPDWKGPDMAGIGKWFRKAKGVFKVKTMAAIHGIRRGCIWFGRKCKNMAVFMWRPFSKLWSRIKKRPVPEEISVNMQNTNMDGEAERALSVKSVGSGQETPEIEGGLRIVKAVNIEQRPKRSFGTVFFRGIVKIWNWFAAFCIWWVRLFWNLLWLFMTLFFGFMAMITLAGVGTMLVLLPQGYPLVGILLICLGAMLCLGALTCGSYSLVLHRKKEEQEPEGKEIPEAEEEQEETPPEETEEQEEVKAEQE